MNQSERRQLKENELARTLSDVYQATSGRGRQLVLVAVGAVAVVLVVIGVNAFRQRGEARGEAMLAEAMVALNARVVPVSAPGPEGEAPAAAQFGSTGTFSTEEAKLAVAIPKLQAAADGAQGSVAGTTARYHLAGALAAVGRHADAVAAFDQVVREAGAGSLYGRMARLGRADAQARAGQVDAAIASWKELVNQKDGDVPVDAVLMELARAYRTKGDAAEVKKALSQLVEQHPNSPYAPEARADLQEFSGS